MMCKVLRGGLRVMGFGSLPAVGETIDIPDNLVPQLTKQGIVEVIESAPVAEPDDDTDEET